MDIDQPTVITVSAWNDPVVDKHGHIVRSLYCERFWLPVIGPTAYLIARRLDYELMVDDDNVTVDLGDLAACMGLSFKHGRSSPFSKAMQRLVMFGLAHHTDDGLALRRFWPTVAVRHHKRWPEQLVVEHNLHINTDPSTSTWETRT